MRWLQGRQEQEGRDQVMEEWEGKSTFPVSLTGPRDCCTEEGRPKGRTVSKKGDLWRVSAVKGTQVFPEP